MLLLTADGVGSSLQEVRRITQQWSSVATMPLAHELVYCVCAE